ncbi:hypothetical protein Vi05172_g8975 [Venturia inaequalis]|nr:hypothetical protein Vi05172_g8975 [Venturia inaequalis]
MKNVTVVCTEVGFCTEPFDPPWANVQVLVAC